MKKNQQNHHPQSSYKEQATMIDTSKIKFRLEEDEALNSDLYNTVAQTVAQTLGAAQGKTTNASTQLRKFYEEIVMWEQKVRQSPEKFPEFLPFIKMLNAKAAYAEGRKLVDNNYKKLIAACLQQVDSVDTMTRFKFFMEAIIGFYKLENK